MTVINQQITVIILTEDESTQTLKNLYTKLNMFTLCEPLMNFDPCVNNKNYKNSHPLNIR